MTVIKFSNGDPELTVPEGLTGVEMMRWICENRRATTMDDYQTFNYAIFDGIEFPYGVYIATFNNVTFKNCKFVDANFNYAVFNDCSGTKNEFYYTRVELSEWITRSGISGKAKTKKMPPILTPSNDAIARKYGVKVVALPNKSFVKIKWTCAFCHRDFVEIARRDKVEQVLKDRMDVPNSPLKVCKTCFSTYTLSDKFYGNRHYGYSGAVGKHTTPMDASNTALIGLEMEFEGDFNGWKELQDAHKGQLHYGYDSSVVGQNELSWDCGSYSWWKYLSSLKDVCNAIVKGNGHPGDSAGIHIHISRPDVNIYDVTCNINRACRSGIWNAIMKSVSLRNNAERFNRYASLAEDCDSHHSGISYNSHRTCEFRIFNSSTDAALILRQMKFCKEVFNLFAERQNKPEKLSKESLALIKSCAKIQLDKGFITTAEYETITKKIK